MTIALTPELVEGADNMMGHVVTHVSWALDNIELDHPGLTPERRHDLDVLKVKLEDIKSKLESMGAEVGA